MKCKGRKANGEPCGKSPMKGREYCIKHGGKTPHGAAHWNYKNGNRSKYIPARLADKYAEAMADPQLAEFRADLSLLESRLCELLITGESLPLWDKAQEEFTLMRKAMAEHNSVDTAYHLSKLESLITRGMADALRWMEIYRVTEQIGKTKEREHKRLVQSAQMISVEQFLAMLGQIADAARRNITNKDELISFTKALDSYGTIATSGDDLGAGH